jgi:CRP-like cAMP-binding protein
MVPSFDEIPYSEVDKFHDYIHRYSKGMSILVENETDKLGLCLLRMGQVGVYKKSAEGKELISTIDAINFFGEMALISGGPRAASIEALSDEVVLYSFRTPDLSTMMSNPTWGMMLVTRLCNDLRQANDKVISLGNENKKNRRQMDHMVQDTAKLLSVVTETQHQIALEAVITSREWKYLTSLEKMTHSLIRTELPEVANQMRPLKAKDWAELRRDGLIPEILASIIQNTQD